MLNGKCVPLAEGEASKSVWLTGFRLSGSFTSANSLTESSSVGLSIRPFVGQETDFFWGEERGFGEFCWRLFPFH